MNTHQVKSHPEHFDAVWRGLKTAELRKDDRGYAVGDVLFQREWSPERYETLVQAYGTSISAQERIEGTAWEEMLARAERNAYTGRAINAVITHIVRGGEWLTPGYVMLSLRQDVAALRQRIADLEADNERLQDRIDNHYEYE